MALALPTNYRRNAFRERNQTLISAIIEKQREKTMNYQLGDKVAHSLYIKIVEGNPVAFVRGKVIDQSLPGAETFSDMVRVMWSDGRSFWVKPRFVQPDLTPEA